MQLVGNFLQNEENAFSLRPQEWVFQQQGGKQLSHLLQVRARVLTLQTALDSRGNVVDAGRFVVGRWMNETAVSQQSLQRMRAEAV